MLLVLPDNGRVRRAFGKDRSIKTASPRRMCTNAKIGDHLHVHVGYGECLVQCGIELNAPSSQDYTTLVLPLSF